VTIHFKELQSLPQREGQMFEEEWGSKLDAAPDDNQFDLFDGQLNQRLRRAEPDIADGKHIRYRARPEPAFSLAQAKNIGFHLTGRPPR
jgi:hypothetical protein